LDDRHHDAIERQSFFIEDFYYLCRILDSYNMKKRKASKQQKVATFKHWALPASAMPVVATFAYLFWKGIPINWLYGAGTLVVILIWAFLLGEGLSRLSKTGSKLSSLGYIIALAAISVGPAIAAAYVGTGKLIWDILWVAGPTSLISAGILRAKNARDIQAPTKCTANMYGIEVILPLAFIGICSMIGILPVHTIIIFMTSPVAVALHRTMKRGVKEGPGPVIDLDTRTVNFLLTFSSLLTISLVAAKFLF
jgi:1,4-dihydroxy-2-naphthoate octaprenyltransferase